MTASQDMSAARRRLTGKRADTVRRLGEATVAALRDVPYSELTFQQIATRAGIARATAYVYFSSKEHLVAEVYWRRLVDTPAPELGEAPPEERVVTALRHLALISDDDPAFGRAAARALLSEDPDVEELRVQVNGEIRSLLAAALGPGHHGRLIELLELVYAGTIVRAGTGHLSYAEAAEVLEHAARIILASPGVAPNP